MAEGEKPHYAWIAIVGGIAVLLLGAAWWTWSSLRSDDREAPSAPSSTGPRSAGTGSTGETPEGRSGDDSAEARDRALAAIGTDIDADEFERARDGLAKAEASFGWSEPLAELHARLDLHENAYRAELRPLEFRVETLESSSEELYARYSIEGTRVFESEPLVADYGAAGTERRANVFHARTSMRLGVTVEFLEPGGMFRGDDVVFGPIELGPLPDTAGGRLEFEDADAGIDRLVVHYGPSPFVPGVHPDEVPTLPRVGARASEIVASATNAIASDHLDVANEALDRLRAEHPGHEEVAFIERRIEAQREALGRNRTTIRLVVLELAVDPKPDGKPWATGGSAPSFRCTVEADDRQIASSDGQVAPFVPAVDALDPPKGNVLVATARGDAKLRVVVKDTSPTFGSTVVGSIALPETLSRFPVGTGVATSEREPTVLVLPKDDQNRVRRMVVRWTVTR